MFKNILRVGMIFILVGASINVHSAFIKNGKIAEKKMVIVIPSYKNAEYCKKNIESVFTQKYENYRIIYVDDCSPDGTGQIVEDYIKELGQTHRVTLIRNKTRIKAMANVYKAIHLCDDGDIVVIINGDDWLYHDQVLARVNEAYQDPNVWLTFGSYSLEPDGIRGVCSGEIPEEVIHNNSYREYRWVTSHLQTFYAGLFKKVKREDFLYQGEYLPMTYDLAMMFPLLEMSGGKFKYIPEVLYAYNFINPISDFRVDEPFQVALEKYIRGSSKYSALTYCPN